MRASGRTQPSIPLTPHPLAFSFALFTAVNRYAAEVKRDAEEFAASEKQKRFDHLAHELRNQQSLAGQIAEHNATHRSGRAPMTELEVTLNRDLLISIAAGRPYEPSSILA